VRGGAVLRAALTIEGFRVDEYADGRLAAFESALTKTLVQVQHGRDKLRGNLPAAPEQIDLRDPAIEQVPPQEINIPVG